MNPLTTLTQTHEPPPPVRNDVGAPTASQERPSAPQACSRASQEWFKMAQRAKAGWFSSALWCFWVLMDVFLRFLIVFVRYLVDFVLILDRFWVHFGWIWGPFWTLLDAILGNVCFFLHGVAASSFFVCFCLFPLSPSSDSCICVLLRAASCIYGLGCLFSSFFHSCFIFWF